MTLLWRFDHVANRAVDRRILRQMGAALAAHVVIGFVVVAAAIGAAPADKPDRVTTNAYSPEDCGLFKVNVSDKSVQCGFVAVPLRHGDANAPRIRLATMVIPAFDSKYRKPDPLFLAQGGPGGSTIRSFAQILLDDAGKRPTLDRDIVLWDQRGTYLSQPRLLCREGRDLPDDASDEAQLAAIRKCGERLTLEAGDLSAFNSLENARDVDAVRAALGYDQFNFYGVSYGTELGQFLMRERPPELRSVILDAVVPLGFSLITDVPAVKQKVMQRYAQACEQSPECKLAYPNLGSRYLALLDRLDKNPVPITALAPPVAQAGGGKTAAAPAKAPTLSGKDLESALYQSVYMRQAVPLVPYVIDRAEQGDFSFAVNLAQLMEASDEEMADGMYMTVVCTENGDTADDKIVFPGLIRRLADAGVKDAKQILEVCRSWKLRLLDKALLQPVKSDIPTLLLSGRFDPITPPEQADRVAATLDRAYKFTFPGGTHGQAFTVSCANRMIAAFLNDPSKAPDGRCAVEEPPKFITPDQVLGLPARHKASTATVREHMVALAGPVFGIIFALALLFSAVPVYSVSEIVRIFRRRARALPGGWRGRLIASAPWVPVLTGFLLLAFLAIAAVSVGEEIQRNQLLLLVGVVPAWVKSLTWWLLPYVLALLLMTVALRLLWRYRARTIFGRVYYTILVLAGWSVLIALLKTDLFF
jgi:pimeloyl-ACP methyl ester carboxylesterase